MRTQQFDIFEATFQPSRTDDLCDGGEEWIGRRLEWQAAYILEDGPYAGEWAFTPLCDEPAPFAWAPARDLTSPERVFRLAPEGR